jgi:hypothetical protein
MDDHWNMEQGCDAEKGLVFSMENGRKRGDWTRVWILMTTPFHFSLSLFRNSLTIMEQVAA